MTRWRWVVCTGSVLLGFAIPTLAQTSSPLDQLAPRESLAQATESSPDQLYANAHAITVKVVLETTWGSGILIGRQGHTYMVLTNRHVLNAGTQYQIQTGDGVLHSATVVQSELGQADLGLLQFNSSDVTYPVATLNRTMPDVGAPLYAAGYPIEDDPSQPIGFAFLNGEVSLIADQSFNGGYQIGSTLAIAKGMSGGPVFNQAGEVVGVNGMHQYPLWGNPYVYLDGSSPSESVQAQMSRYSWSVPIQTFLSLASQLATNEFPGHSTVAPIMRSAEPSPLPTPINVYPIPVQGFPSRSSPAPTPSDSLPPLNL